MPNEATMYVIKADWGGKPSFRLIPFKTDCPYHEAIFDPSEKTLALISKEKRTMLQLVPKLNLKGDALKLPKPRLNGKDYAEERLTIESFYEYYITDTVEIQTIVSMLGLNHETFDFTPFF
jgi:hypothetical protein